MFIIIGCFKSYFLPIKKSLGSCAGVHFMAPVPNLISTYSSAMTGIMSLFAGLITFLPIISRYLLSLGLTTIQASPNIVSGLVVAIVKYLFLSFSKRYLK